MLSKKHLISHLNNKRSGFTLIELLMAMAIIGILAGMFFSLGGGVTMKAEIERAKMEMEVISQALVVYKNKHGDYPWNNGSDANDINVLSDALLGLTDPQGKEIESVNNTISKPLVGKGLVIVEIDGAEVIIDPWENPYIYLYDEPMNPDGSGGRWETLNFILISKGPDGSFSQSGIDSVGTLNYEDHIADENNQDNVVHRH